MRKTFDYLAYPEMESFVRRQNLAHSHLRFVFNLDDSPQPGKLFRAGEMSRLFRVEALQQFAKLVQLHNVPNRNVRDHISLMANL